MRRRTDRLRSHLFGIDLDQPDVARIDRNSIQRGGKSQRDDSLVVGINFLV